jgi:hypothetical protein
MLKQRFYDSCSQSRCSDALQTFLSMLSGDVTPQANCDILVSLSDGAFSGQFYEGWTDQLARVSTFTVDMLMVALSVQVGQMSMQNADKSQAYNTWINVASSYVRQVQAAINRVKTATQISLNNVMWNA